MMAQQTAQVHRFYRSYRMDSNVMQQIREWFCKPKVGGSNPSPGTAKSQGFRGPGQDGKTGKTGTGRVSRRRTRRHTSVAILFWLAAGPAFAGDLPVVPDPRLTPGAIASTSAAEVCTPGYSAMHRLRFGGPGDHARWLAILRAYHLTPRQTWGRIELDHLIPICAGGADTEQNMWPEPIGQAIAKDRIEAVMCRAVCKRGLRLDTAQRYFIERGWLPEVRGDDERD